ncbi:MAG: hypothetical protein GY816_10955 [Cytophagales bacterium]|nr:hypothetical protein [Cytophagales bacterium]
MSRKYKFRNAVGLYFVSFAVVCCEYVFSREVYCEKVIIGIPVLLDRNLKVFPNLAISQLSLEFVLDGQSVSIDMMDLKGKILNGYFLEPCRQENKQFSGIQLCENRTVSHYPN